MIPPSSREILLEAMARFDREERDTDAWREWESNLVHKYAIRHDDRLYPVKKIISLAIGLPRGAFYGGDEANGYARQYGFDIVPLRPPTGPQTRTWVFQANPGRYDLAAALAALPEMTWRVPKRTSEVQEGDLAYLWETGPDAGLVAMGTIVSEPVVLPGPPEEERAFFLDGSLADQQTPRVRVRIIQRFEPRIPRSAIVEEPVLASVAVFRGVPGSNYLLTTEQAIALSQFIAQIDSMDGPARPFEAILETLRTSGLHFSPEVVANYLLALQTKRLVILSGISGTGKTHLARAVAHHYRPRVTRRRAVHVPEDAEVTEGQPDGLRLIVPSTEVREEWLENTCMVPVRPDWTDNRGLLGYHNPLLEQYSPTPVLKLLLRAQTEYDRAVEEGRPVPPFFLILDEMNLARVEHYFSDFLSAMESGEAIPLHEEAGLAVQAEGLSRPVPTSLRIPPNLFITGTVNIDETTHMFSPKVLDRAFTIELHEVDLNGYGNPDLPTPMGAALVLDGLPHSLPPVESLGESHWNQFSVLLDGELREALVAVHALLARYQRHFGYWVANEIARFVTLAAKQGGNSPEILWAALDLAVLQKVLPKFHGTQGELQRPLEDLLAFAIRGGSPSGGGGEEALSEALAESALPTEPGATPTFPRTAAKVRRMLDRLQQHGFTSYMD